MSGQTAAEQGQEVRSRLLAAAAELIPEYGWTGVSTRKVAERAGVAPGLVHYHFASLQSLLRRAAVTTVAEVLATAKPTATGDEPAAALARLLSPLDRYDGTDPTSLLFTEAYLAASRDETLRGQLAQLAAAYRRELADWLAARGAPLPEQTAAVFAAAIDGVLLHRALNPELTSARVAPVLGRLLSAGGAGAAGRD